MDERTASFLRGWLAEQARWDAAGVPRDRTKRASKQKAKKMKKGTWAGGEQRRPESSEAAMPHCDITSDWPALTEFLWAVRWDDGTPRTPGSIVMFRQDDKWKAAVSDKDRGLVCFVSAPTLRDLFDSINDGVLSDSLEWRTQKPDQGGTQKIRK